MARGNLASLVRARRFSQIESRTSLLIHFVKRNTSNENTTDGEKSMREGWDGEESSFPSGTIPLRTNDECEGHNVDNGNNTIKDADATRKRGSERITSKIMFQKQNKRLHIQAKGITNALNNSL